MSHSEEADNEYCEFKWGKMKGRGRQWNDVKFYESFTYNGVEYFLYDCVYLRFEDDPVHYIGKLVKIWDHPNYRKRVTVVWFFRPLEITHWLGDIRTSKNEIFLASGEGPGVVNINPVEALVGKCNVACISEDDRNPRASEEQRRMANHIFYRTFDVGKFTISNKFENKIAGIEVKYFFNRNEDSKLIRDPKPKGTELKKPKVEDEVELKSEKDVYNSNSSIYSSFKKIELDYSAKHSLQQELKVSPPPVVVNVSSTTPTVRKPRMSVRDAGKSFASHVGTSEPEGEVGASHVRTSDNEGKVGPSHVRKSDDEAKLKSVKDIYNSDSSIYSSFEKIRLDNSAKNSLQQELKFSPPPVVVKVPSTAPTVRKPRMSIRDVGMSFASHLRTSEHERKVGASHVTTSDHEGKVGRLHVRKSEHEGKMGASHVKTSEHERKVGGSYVRTFEHDGKVGSAKDSVGQERLLSSEEGFSKKETMLYHKAKPELAHEKGANIDIHYPKMKEPVKGFVRSDGGISRTIDLSRKTTKLSDKVAPELAREKATKTDIQCFKMEEPDRIEKRMKEPVKGFVRQDGGISRTMDLGKKATKFSDKEATERAQEKGKKTYTHVVEVKQRPDVDRSKWFKQLPWEERMDNAYQKGSLVLLQNLDPSYTSAEIEGIIWSFFEEKCTAKVLQDSTYSSPHNGQALVIFKSCEKAEMVITELRKRCLMLPNGRPLMAQGGPPRVVPDKTSKFVGHLTIDKINLHKQREQRMAVSTSHFAQSNTVEYDMALEWIVLQKRSEATWKALYEQHGMQLADLKAQLKEH